MTKIPPEYKKGFTLFLGYKIDLSKKVLIPRLETEYWVRKALKEIKQNVKKNEKLKFLDIFAGSGCIGISALKEIKNSYVDFIDVESKSVSQIKKNLKLNQISKERYNVYLSSFFNKLEKGKKGGFLKYDVIFANPPYVAKERISEVGLSVLKYEPPKSLFSGKKGLRHIKKFLKVAPKFLKKKGKIYLEFDPRQVPEIKKILEENNYQKAKFYKDQFKKYRFAKIEI